MQKILIIWFAYEFYLGDAWISCDRKTSLKVEVLKRTNDFEGEASQEDENEVNYESKYSEDEEDKRKGSFDPKKGSKIVNKMGRVPKSRAQNLRWRLKNKKALNLHCVDFTSQICQRYSKDFSMLVFLLLIS